MLKRLIQILFITLVLAGCVQNPTYTPGERSVRYGKILDIEPVSLAGRKLGIGTLLGGVAGGYGGHNIGKGHGKDAATIVGAIAGAAAGNIAEEHLTRKDGQLVTVKLDNHSTIEVTQPALHDLQIGDRVRVIGGDHDTRVVRQ